MFDKFSGPKPIFWGKNTLHTQFFSHYACEIFLSLFLSQDKMPFSLTTFSKSFWPMATVWFVEEKPCVSQNVYNFVHYLKDAPTRT